MIFKERSINRSFKRYVDEKDLSKIRTTWCNALDIDPTFENWKIEFDYQNKYFPDGWDPHIDLTPFINDESKWDKAYWSKLKRDLNKNCSIERLEFMRKVAQVYMKDKIDLINHIRNKNKKTESVDENYQKLKEEKENFEKLRLEELKKYDLV